MDKKCLTLSEVLQLAGHGVRNWAVNGDNSLKGTVEGITITLGSDTGLYRYQNTASCNAIFYYAKSMRGDNILASYKFSVDSLDRYERCSARNIQEAYENALELASVNQEHAVAEARRVLNRVNSRR